MKMNRFVLQNTIPQPIRFGSMVFLASIIFLTPHLGPNAIILRPTTMPSNHSPRAPRSPHLILNQKDEREKKRSSDVLAKATEVCSLHFIQHRLYLRLPLIRSKYQFYVFLFVWRVSALKYICLCICAFVSVCALHLPLSISLNDEHWL